jgi:hypothetical protein
MYSPAELARLVNEEIRALAQDLNSEGDQGNPYRFLCEDGCGAKVVLTLAAYVAANGAWLDGHKLLTPSNSTPGQI